jgi:hypothetical protein
MNRTDQRTLWKQRIGDWQRSGLSAPTYAAKHGLRVGALYRWKQRLSRYAEASAPRFVELTVHRPTGVAVVEPALSARMLSLGAPEQKPLEVVLGDGLRVRVPDGFSSETLRRVVDTLERR